MANKIRVKFLSKNGIKAFHFETLAHGYPEIDYVFNVAARDYDWLVVYDDLPAKEDERFSQAEEALACPPENTILITYEPSSIKIYSDDYTRQYGYVLTSQEAEHLPHPGRVDCPPVGYWYYGDETDLIDATSPPIKTDDVSIFLSTKADGHTMHRLRHEFSRGLTDHFGDKMERFGKAYNFVEKKSEGLDRFRYTVALENHIGDHHWTEKLSDAFLGFTLPFYAGSPNAADYFPEDSFVSLNMYDLSGSIEIVERSIRDDIFTQRLPAIIEARRRVIETHSLPNFIGQTIEAATDKKRMDMSGHSGVMLSRRRMRNASLMHGLRYSLQKIKSRYYFLNQNKKARHD